MFSFILTDFSLGVVCLGSSDFFSVTEEFRGLVLLILMVLSRGLLLGWRNKVDFSSLLDLDSARVSLSSLPLAGGSMTVLSRGLLWLSERGDIGLPLVWLINIRFFSRELARDPELRLEGGEVPAFDEVVWSWESVTVFFFIIFELLRLLDFFSLGVNVFVGVTSELSWGVELSDLVLIREVLRPGLELLLRRNSLSVLRTERYLPLSLFLPFVSTVE